MSRPKLFRRSALFLTGTLSTHLCSHLCNRFIYFPLDLLLWYILESLAHALDDCPQLFLGFVCSSMVFFFIMVSTDTTSVSYVSGCGDVADARAPTSGRVWSA